MKIDTQTVDKIANLAKLEFTDSAKQEMVNDLSRIITFVEKLNELDTENIEPLIYMSDEVNVLRADIVKHDISQQEALKNAPKKDSDYIKAPKVLGEVF
jgi:aspartyl-tRNA(Asn)/glutamyl-tRNA(Gln) amidotransferase subunit C